LDHPAWYQTGAKIDALLVNPEQSVHPNPIIDIDLGQNGGKTVFWNINIEDIEKWFNGELSFKFLNSDWTLCDGRRSQALREPLKTPG